MAYAPATVELAHRRRWWRWPLKYRQTAWWGLLALACAPTGPTGGRPAWLSRCHVDGFDVETLCGTVDVPERRDGEAGRTLSLRVVVVPSVRPVPDADPLVLLAGGPGQAATEAYGPLMPALVRVQQRRDLIMVDMRGTGQSAPLDCPSDAEETLARHFSTDPHLDEILDCRNKLIETGAHLPAFNTRNHSADLEAVREALGVSTWNIYGGSYGTRAALDYAETYPHAVRSLVLDGVAPRELVLFGTFGTDGQAALDKLVTDCAADVDGCAAAFPDLAGRLATLFQRDATPISVVHPRTGEAETIPLTGTAIASAMRNVLYVPEIAAMLPYAVQVATDPEPNFQPLVSLLTSVGGDALADSMSLGLLLSVACAEDVPYIDESLIAASQKSFLGDIIVGPVQEWCAAWPVAPIPRQAAVAWPGPVLLLSGALDPVTPPRWAEAAAQTLPGARSVVVPGGGHIVVGSGCVPEVLADFLSVGTGEGLDVACAADVARPPFVLDFAGPQG